MLNVNFMGKLPPTNKVVSVLKADAENFFPHSAPVKATTKGITEGVAEGLSKAEIESYMASRAALPAKSEANAAIEELKAKAAESYAKSHGSVGI